MKLIKKILSVCFFLLLTLILVGLGYYWGVTRKVTLRPDKLLINEKTIVLYDGNGEIVRSATAPFLPQTVKIEELPAYTKNAFIDTEDKRFYSHRGYDVKRIARATLNNLKTGSFKEGASTISQQLIKNTHLSQEKTVKRKLREWKLTRQLEKTYTKEEILEKYLNTIYFGHSCFGIASAADFYFQKSPAELTLADSAILAGLVKSPNNYSPYKQPERCLRRKNTVLNAMLRNGSISQEEKREAENAPLPQYAASNAHADYAHYVFDELAALSEEYDFKLGGDIVIHTYLQPELQKQVEAIADGYTESDKTLLVLDGQTHGFKACVSTVGNIPRLPGSLLKPLLVYAPAVEENLLSPATPILDAKINYSGYAPENYDKRFHGYVSAREAVEKSLNIPAVKTLETLTLPKAVAYMEKLGLPVSKEDESLALALGGMQKGYGLKELINAYATLQNGGVFQTSGFISSVAVNGKTVYKKPTSAKRVFSEESAYLMTDMLRTTAIRGTAKKLRSLPFAVAAKTGTSGNKNGNTDAYAVSYTPIDCAAVWLGNADNTPISHTGGGAPCNLLFQINELLGEYYQSHNLRIDEFTKPKNIRDVSLDRAAYYDTHTLLLADELAPKEYTISELFKNNAMPLDKSTSFSIPHIPTPQLSLSKEGVLLHFNESSPTYYTYKIDRFDYVTHTTVYEGKFLASFTDTDLQKDKNYVYTVTPYFQGRKGKSITLPTVSTKSNAPPEILSKEWWDY